MATAIMRFEDRHLFLPHRGMPGAAIASFRPHLV
jgi:hypothetical protein